jgi:hypothetical protein
MIELLNGEKETFHKYQNSLRVEEAICRLKTQRLLLIVGDRNTTFFHK